MVENDVMNTIDNQPEVVQPIEAVKSPVILDEENSSISNANQLEAIVQSGITNSPTIPRASSNVNNSSDGSIDFAKKKHNPSIPKLPPKCIVPVKVNRQAVQKRLVSSSPYL
jgi:hypothetical protein